jgi:hypothetical protein
MTNIRRENGVIKAIYNDIEYIFRTTIEFIIAYSTARNIEQYNAKIAELEESQVIL